jgi:hypothetical protein
LPISQKSTYAVGYFVINAFVVSRATDVVAARALRRKAGCADSESRLLAIKKFLRRPALRLIAARQDRFLMRIAADRFATAFWLTRRARRASTISAHHAERAATIPPSD